MKLHELKYVEGSQKTATRVGRGMGSGLGKTAGAGYKGQNSRSGGGVRRGFEGGQNPIYRRISKRGFTNPTRVEYNIINIKDLEVFENGTVVCPTCLKQFGLVRQEKAGVKILGDGQLTKALTVQAHKFSASAIKAIEAAGGKCEVI